MLADWCELARLLKIQVMGHGEGLRPGLDQVERILVPFPSFTAAGSRCSALNYDDSTVPVMSGEKVQ